MIPRDYQAEAIAGIKRAFANGARSVLLVLPTGLGKTVVFVHMIHQLCGVGERAMVMAHREELLTQASDTIATVMGEYPELEMGPSYADKGGFMSMQSSVVVTSVQTQSRGRMRRFDPNQFSFFVCDEGHRGASKSYRSVFDYYQTNPNLLLLAVTATKNRHDKKPLIGQVYDCIVEPFKGGISEAIECGWLVEIDQQSVYIDGLDFSEVGTSAGDLNGRDLARVMEYEKPLQGIADATFRESKGLKTLLFAASVPHAIRTAEILNRHESGCAAVIHGKTDREVRRETMAAYRRGDFRLLCNFGVATEGLDVPDIGCIGIARPTKSNPLWTQMLGRGTRPLSGLVDRYPDPESRRNAIAASGKPRLLVLDFVGNAGQHKLINAVDALAGSYSDEVVERAKEIAERSTETTDIRATLTYAEKQLREEEAELQRARERADEVVRQGVVAKARYRMEAVSPFDRLGISPKREPGWHRGRQPTPKMVEALEKQGIDNAGEYSFWHVRQMLDALQEQRNERLCSKKQLGLLKRFGYDASLTTHKDARTIIDAIKANGWSRPECNPLEVEHV